MNAAPSLTPCTIALTAGDNRVTTDLKVFIAIPVSMYPKGLIDIRKAVKPSTVALAILANPVQKSAHNFSAVEETFAYASLPFLYIHLEMLTMP